MYRSYHIWHDGTLTAGRRGRLKNAVVINYIKENDNTLLKEGKIFSWNPSL